MKTLVIHPTDTSTDFLKLIYESTDYTVINDTVTKKKIKDEINCHDRIIIMGHGTELGLLRISTSRNHRYDYFIDSRYVYLLRQKLCIFIWCNADEFVKKHKLKGFYTGMIISENEEANLFCINCEYSHIEASNILFAKAIKDSINSSDMLSTAKSIYNTKSSVNKANPIIKFNETHLYYNGSTT